MNNKQSKNKKISTVFFRYDKKNDTKRKIIADYS